MAVEPSSPYVDGQFLSALAEITAARWTEAAKEVPLSDEDLEAIKEQLAD